MPGLRVDPFQDGERMKVLELFAGTRSIGRAFERKGHDVFSIDYCRDFEGMSLYADIGELTAEDILEKFGHPNVIWASPCCVTYSVAGIRYHRKPDPATGRWILPADTYAAFCDRTNEHLIELIRELDPEIWFIENPKGNLQHMPFMQPLNGFKNDVCYCQYGDRRKKPTNIWTNADISFLVCPGATCGHWRSKGGASDLVHGSKSRGVIPEGFCDYIVSECERLYND